MLYSYSQRINAISVDALVFGYAREKAFPFIRKSGGNVYYAFDRAGHTRGILYRRSSKNGVLFILFYYVIRALRGFFTHRIQGR